MIKVENVSFRYADKAALTDIGLTIPKGSFYSIVGPNGSGKTTLFKLFSRSYPVQTGKISLAGKDLGTYSVGDLARIITLVPQNMTIRFPFTCLEVVLMGRTPFSSRLTHVSQADLDIVQKAMEDTQTLAFAERKITELSGGEQQRVFLAKALAQQPKVLFLDEAFANMDIYYTIACLNIIKQKIEQEALTVVSIMHDLNMVANFSTHAALLSYGTIIKEGKASDVITPELIYKVFGITVVKAGPCGLAVVNNI